MNDEQFMKRVAEVAAGESMLPARWHYLSFADKNFLGSVVIKVRGVLDASLSTRELGINPGGEMICVPIRDESTLPPEEFRNRLLSREDVLKLWPDSVRLGDMDS